MMSVVEHSLRFIMTTHLFLGMNSTIHLGFGFSGLAAYFYTQSMLCCCKPRALIKNLAPSPTKKKKKERLLQRRRWNGFFKKHVIDKRNTLCIFVFLHFCCLVAVKHKTKSCVDMEPLYHIWTPLSYYLIAHH